MALRWVDTTPSSEGMGNNVDTQPSETQRNTGGEIVSTSPRHENDHKQSMERRHLRENLSIENNNIFEAQNHKEIGDLEEVLEELKEKRRGGGSGLAQRDTVPQPHPGQHRAEPLHTTMDNHSDRGYDSDMEEKIIGEEERMGKGMMRISPSLPTLPSHHLYQRDLDFHEIDVGGVFCLDEDVDWMIEQQNRSIDQQREYEDEEEMEDRMEAPSRREQPYSNYEELIPIGRHRRSGNESVHPSELSTVWSRIRSESSRNGSPPITIPGRENSAEDLPRPTVFDFSSEKIEAIERQNHERTRDLMYHLMLRLHPFALNGSRDGSNLGSLNGSPHFC